MLTVYVSFAVMYAVFYLCGYPLRVLLLEDDMERFDLYVTPWLGIGVIIVFFLPMSWLGHSVKSLAGPFIVAVTAVCVALRVKFRKTPRVERGEVLIILAVALLVGAVYGFIPARNGFENLVVVADDFGAYLICLRGAMDSNAAELAGLAQEIASDALNFQLRGCVFVPAFLVSVFKVDIAPVFYFSSAFVMFLCVIQFRLFLEHEKLFVILPLIAILTFNAFYQKFFLFAFIGQLFSFGIITLAFYLEYRLVERGSFKPRTCALLAFLLIFNGYSYLEGLAYPLIPVLSVPLILKAGKKYAAAPCARNAALTGGLFVIFSVPSITLFVKNFFKIQAEQPGWAMHLPTLMDVAGLQGVFSSPDAVFAAMVISNLLIAAALLIQLKREGFSFLSVSSCLFMFLHVFFIERYFDRDSATSYNSFKSALSLSFVAVILLFRFTEDALVRFEKAVRGNAVSLESAEPGGRGWIYFSVTAFSLLFVLNAVSAWRSLKSLEPLVGRGQTSKNRAALKYLAENEAYSEKDFIVNGNFTMEHYTADAYLPLGRTHTLGHSVAYKPHMKSSISPGDIYVSGTVGENVFKTVEAEALFGNSTYRVFMISPGSLLRVDYGGMAYELDDEIGASRGATLSRKLTSGKVIFQYVAVSDRVVSLTYSFFDEKDAELLARVSVNGISAGEFVKKEGYLDVRLENQHFQAGPNDIVITFQGDFAGVSLVRESFD